MDTSLKPLIVALEEHYWDPDLVALFPGREGKRVSDVERRLLDMGEVRLREMDEAGIDIQVLSHGAPGTQKLPADAAKKWRDGRTTASRSLSVAIRSALPASDCSRHQTRQLPQTNLSESSASLA